MSRANTAGLTENGEDAEEDGDESWRADAHLEVGSFTLGVDPVPVTATHSYWQRRDTALCRSPSVVNPNLKDVIPGVVHTEAAVF